MNKRIGLFGPSLIAMAAMCMAAPAPAKQAQAETKPPDSGGGGNAASSLPPQIQSGLDKIDDLIQKNFPERIVQGATVLSIAADIIKEHAQKPAAQSESIAEGSSATLIGADGNGTAEVYVIGVNAKQGHAAVYGQPARLVPLKHLKLIKRGHPIIEAERVERSKVFPTLTWDERKD